MRSVGCLLKRAGSSRLVRGSGVRREYVVQLPVLSFRFTAGFFFFRARERVVNPLPSLFLWSHIVIFRAINLMLKCNSKFTLLREQDPPHGDKRETSRGIRPPRCIAEFWLKPHVPISFGLGPKSKAITPTHTRNKK